MEEQEEGSIAERSRAKRRVERSSCKSEVIIRVNNFELADYMTCLYTEPLSVVAVSPETARRDTVLGGTFT